MSRTDSIVAVRDVCTIIYRNKLTFDFQFDVRVRFLNALYANSIMQLFVKTLSGKTITIEVSTLLLTKLNEV